MIPTIGDNFFIDNPDKILGEMSISDFRNTITVKGSREKVEEYFKENLSAEKMKKESIVVKEKTKSILTIEDNIKKYTPHLSDNDIKAFVWYNRTLGIPMTGWEKWFIKGTKKELIKAKEEVVYFNNQWNEIGKFLPNQEVGKLTRFEHKYNGILYVAVRGLDGVILLIDKSKIEEEKVYTVDKAELSTLVKSNSLLYLNGDYVPLHIYTNTDYQILRSSLTNDKETIIKEFGQEVYDYHEGLLSSYTGFRIDEPNPDKRYRLNPFGDIARNFEMEYEGMTTDLSNAFLDHCRGLKQSSFELVSKQEFTNIIIYGYERAARGSSDDEKEGHKVDVNNAFIEAERLFSDFLYSSLEKEYQVKLNVIINETYNRSLIVNHDKIPVGFVCSYLFNNSPFSLTPVQVEAFKYSVSRNSFCLALTVGFGKTSCAIAILSYLISSGTAKRPMLVVPKPVLKNWIKETMGYWSDHENNIYFSEKPGLKRHFGILSETGIELNFLSNLNLANQNKLKKNPIKDSSITLISYEALDKIFIKDKDEREHIIKTWLAILKQSDKEDSDRDESKKMLSLINSLNSVDKNAVIPIDETMIDFIMVDEAHRLKNMFTGVSADKTNRVNSGFKGSSSNRALRAFYLTQYMHKNYKGRIGFLSATPFSNSPLEVFTMMCFLGYNELVKNNVHNIQRFVEQFFNETFDYKINSKNKIVVESVMKKYKNKRILYKLLNNIFIYRNDPTIAGISRPCIIRYPNKEQKVILKMSDLQMIQRGYLGQDNKITKAILAKIEQDDLLGAYYEDFRESVNAMERGKSDIGLAGSILAASRISALSPFSQSPVMLNFQTLERWREVYDHSPKVKFTVDCIKEMIAYHIGRGEKPSSFVIYSSLGNNILPYIKQALESVVGFKKNILNSNDDDEGNVSIDEVEIMEAINGSDKELNRRELVQSLFNDGTVKVIIGTATIKEGVNLQKNSATLFNLTPDWNSTDVEQVEGRVHRQGNRYGYARIITPLVIGTLDSFIYQKYEEKKSRLKDIWEDDGQMVTDDMNVEISPEKQKELILSDEDQIAKIRIDIIKRKLQNQFNKVNDDINLLTTGSHTITQYNEFLSRSIALLENITEVVKSNINALKFLRKLSKDKLPKGITHDRIDTILGYYDDFKLAVDQATNSRDAKDIVNIISPSFLRRNLYFDLKVYEERYEFEQFMIKHKFKNHQNLLNKEILIYPYAIPLIFDNPGSTGSAIRSLKEVFANAKLIEREILIPNELTLASPIEKLNTINDVFKQKKEEILAFRNTMFSPEGEVLETYYNSLTLEIKASLEKENSMANNPEQMVYEFTERTNVQLSYLKDEVDLVKCPIPKVECCDSNGSHEKTVATYKELELMPEDEKKAAELALRIRIAKVKAKAILILYEYEKAKKAA